MKKFFIFFLTLFAFFFLYSPHVVFAQNECQIQIAPVSSENLEILDEGRLRITTQIALQGLAPNRSFNLHVFRKIGQVYSYQINSSVNPSSFTTTQEGDFSGQVTITYDYSPDVSYYLFATDSSSSYQLNGCTGLIPKVSLDVIKSKLVCGKFPSEVGIISTTTIKLGPKAVNTAVYTAGLTGYTDSDGTVTFDIPPPRIAEGSIEGIEVVRNNDPEEIFFGDLIPLCSDIDLTEKINRRPRLQEIRINTGRGGLEVHIAGVNEVSDSTGVVTIVFPDGVDIYQGSKRNITITMQSDEGKVPGDIAIPQNAVLVTTDSDKIIMSQEIDLKQAVDFSIAKLRQDLLEKQGTPFVAGLVGKIGQSQNCVLNGTRGIVSKGNTDSCVGSVQPIPSETSAIILSSAKNFDFLQCVGFVKASVSGATGLVLDDQFVPYARNYAETLPRGYGFISRNSLNVLPQPGDLAVWDGVSVLNPRTGRTEKTAGHVAFVIGVDSAYQFEVAEANYGADGLVERREIPLNQDKLLGFARRENP